MHNFEEGSAAVPPRSAFGAVIGELRRTPLLALIAVVPVVFLLEQVSPEAHTLLFLLSVAAIVPC
ncbi:hypothetical protein ABIA24_005585 [Sinorhizobium fredii]